MRDLHQEILYNLVGQSLIWDAPEGRPSSVTSVVVYRADQDDDGPSEFTATGTVETNPNTTTVGTSGSSQADPTQIVLTLATGVTAGRQYVIASAANGDTETFVVEQLSGSTITARSPLINDYPAGSTIQSARITAPVDAAWVASKTKLSPETEPAPWYRAVFTYVAGGVTYRAANFLDLVRYTTRHTVTPPDVDELKAGWLDGLPVDYRREQGRPLIAQAARELRLEMLADGKALRWVRHLDVVNELVVLRAIVVAEAARVQNFGVGFNASYQLALETYERRYRQLIREPKVATVVASGGAATTSPGQRLPLTVR